MKFTSNFLELGDFEKSRYSLTNISNTEIATNFESVNFTTLIRESFYGPHSTSIISSTNYFELRVGSSDENKASYTLDSPIEDLYIVKGQNTINDKSMTLQITLKNNNTETRIIKEIGIFYKSYMFAKEILSTPVEIKPNESYTFLVTLFLFIPNRVDSFSTNFKTLFLHTNTNCTQSFYNEKLISSNGQQLKIKESLTGSEMYNYIFCSRSSSGYVDNHYTVMRQFANNNLLPSTDNRDNTEDEIVFANQVETGTNNYPCGVFILCGDSTIPPTQDDFRIHSPVNLTPISITKTTEGFITYKEVFVNNTGSDIVVNEVGLYTMLNPNVVYVEGDDPSADKYSSRRILLCRQVIEPVVVHDQEVYTFSMQIF